MKKLLVLVTLIAALAALYYWAAVDSRMPEDAGFDLDIAQIRALADTVPGAQPVQIRYEHVLSFEFPRAMAVAGDDWSGVDIPVYAFQVVYPDRSVIIDTAMERAAAKPEFMVPFYDDTAYQRMQQAIDKASLIVITHEHMDHLGGIAAHPNVAALLPVLKLTDEQRAHPERVWPATLPDGIFDNSKPFQYERYHAVAPGMVLIKAPGHTPGSQMVYVRLADGREVLFLGDVVWKLRNIETQRERPRWSTAMIREDRHAVFGQIKALHALSQAQPGIEIVPGHDGPVIEELRSAGLLQPGF